MGSYGSSIFDVLQTEISSMHMHVKWWILSASTGLSRHFLVIRSTTMAAERRGVTDRLTGSERKIWDTIGEALNTPTHPHTHRHTPENCLSKEKHSSIFQHRAHPTLRGYRRSFYFFFDLELSPESAHWGLIECVRVTCIQTASCIRWLPLHCAPHSNLTFALGN